MKLSALPGSACACLHPRAFLRTAIALVLCIFCAAASADDTGENRFDAIIHEIASHHQIDPFLIKAMIWHESRFRPLARGRDGEIGLMQIKMDVVRDWAKARGVPVPAPEQVFDPYVNIEIGTWYFARAFRKWSKSSHALLLALGEYNAGPGRLRRWIRKAGGKCEQAVARSASAAYVRSIRDRYLAYTLEYASQIAAGTPVSQWNSARGQFY